MHRRFGTIFNLARPAFTFGDLLILLVLAAVLYVGVRLAVNAPSALIPPSLSLAPSALAWYALLSVGRMSIAYLFSLGFTLVYGYVAVHSRFAEKVLMPLLDVLQSVPILSFLPVVLLSLTAILPQGAAIELSSIILIVTSQVWNMTFSFYQTLTTIPRELHEATRVFQLNRWLSLKTMELPFATLPLVWNSMMSWAGGWFFLMAAETFTVGERDFRLPGLGSYLQTAANDGDVRAIFMGLGTLIVVIVLMDRFVWRPMLVWANKFKVESTESGDPPESGFYNVLSRSWLLEQFGRHIWSPISERIDLTMGRIFAGASAKRGQTEGRSPLSIVLLGIGGLALAIFLAYNLQGVVRMLVALPVSDWGRIGLGTLATLARVVLSLLIALVWTLPVGVAIGSNPRLAAPLSPVVQIVAAIPATALFPIALLVLLRLPAGLNIAAVLLMLMGTQWYLLFNIIAGVSAIPQDLIYMSKLLQLRKWDRWRTLYLPALFPYLVTGLITAGGGAWNASIVAEHTHFGGRTFSTTGVGALISEATARGDYALLLGATLTMILTVVGINRLFWRRLYRLAEEKYRVE